jgi:hypothetical protein
LRPMKSLRKSMFFAIVGLSFTPFTSVRAQSSKPDTPAPVPGAQQPPPADTPVPGQGRIGISVNQVIVPVTVKDSSGRLVADLSKDEFRVLEDKVEQRIAYFSNEAFPLSMAVLIDNDLKVKDAGRWRAACAPYWRE